MYVNPFKFLQPIKLRIMKFIIRFIIRSFIRCKNLKGFSFNKTTNITFIIRSFIISFRQIGSQSADFFFLHTSMYHVNKNHWGYHSFREKLLVNEPTTNLRHKCKGASVKNSISSRGHIVIEWSPDKTTSGPSCPYLTLSTRRLIKDEIFIRLRSSEV